MQQLLLFFWALTAPCSLHRSDRISSVGAFQFSFNDCPCSGSSDGSNILHSALLKMCNV